MTRHLLNLQTAVAPSFVFPPFGDCVAIVISRRSREILFLYLPENARFLARARNDKVGYFALRHSLLRGRCKKGAFGCTGPYRKMSAGDSARV
jgi:hypothetical protein